MKTRACRAIPLVAVLAVLAGACGGKGDSGPAGPTAAPTPAPAPAPIPRAATFVNHTTIALARIPIEWIERAKATLHIAYGHTSHGSQLVSGMNGLVGFRGPAFAFRLGGTGGALDLRDTPFSGASDLGNPDRTAWASATRNYLRAQPDVNVVMWSWCGQVSNASPGDIDTYLTMMSALEEEFPGVRFVYMTGHLDGTGMSGNLHQRNEQIRQFCQSRGRTLYDFADIETHDPDGRTYSDRIPNDACDYDSDGDGRRDRNWATDWQNSHTRGVDWFECPSAHSQPLNANMKAVAAWWLFARLAGWGS